MVRKIDRPAGELKVLIVDDDAEYVLQIARRLKKSTAASFSSESASSLKQALEMLERETFNAVLLDLNLPDSRDLKTFETLRLRMPNPLPVVILSGVSDEGIAMQAVRLGAQDYLFKSENDLSSVGRSVVHAVERFMLYREIELKSMHDGLTGLLNRRGFDVLALEQIKKAAQDKTSLRIILIDLDGLKQINDKYGHLQGDLAIQQTALLIRDAFASGCLFARLGGDEYAVLAVGADEAQISQALERFAKNIDIYNERKSGLYRLSVSLGTAAYKPGSDVAIEQMIQRADKMLYQEKLLKKNRIVIV